MTLFRRIKNLWLLSAYRVDEIRDKKLVKDVSTVKHRMAKIVKDDSRNPLEIEIDTQNGETS